MFIYKIYLDSPITAFWALELVKLAFGFFANLKDMLCSSCFNTGNDDKILEKV